MTSANHNYMAQVCQVGRQVGTASRDGGKAQPLIDKLIFVHSFIADSKRNPKYQELYTSGEAEPIRGLQTEPHRLNSQNPKVQHKEKTWESHADE